jgi:hypothetical protein
LPHQQNEDSLPSFHLRRINERILTLQGGITIFFLNGVTQNSHTLQGLKPINPRNNNDLTSFFNILSTTNNRARAIAGYIKNIQ